MDVTFQERAVAFIDVLGFKSVVENAATGGREHKILVELISALEGSVIYLNGQVNKDVPREAIPKHISISDSIILSAPLTIDSSPVYCGLSAVVMRVIQLTHILLSKGYLVRGGISTGKVWHSDSNIVGPAYQEAYRIETMTSAPRVELSYSACAYWKKGLSIIPNNMCMDYRGKFIVNGLHDSYIQTWIEKSPEKAFQLYYKKIEERLAEEEVESARYKWWWFGELLKSEAMKHGFSLF